MGVEAERCCSFANAIKHGKPTYTHTEASLADGLAVPTVGCNALATAGDFKQTIVDCQDNLNNLRNIIAYQIKVLNRNSINHCFTTKIQFLTTH